MVQLREKELGQEDMAAAAKKIGLTIPIHTGPAVRFLPQLRPIWRRDFLWRLRWNALKTTFPGRFAPCWIWEKEAHRSIMALQLQESI